MLETALEFMNAFSCMAEIDSSYKSNPSVEEWENVRIVCEYL